MPPASRFPAPPHLVAPVGRLVRRAHAAAFSHEHQVECLLRGQPLHGFIHCCHSRQCLGVLCRARLQLRVEVEDSADNQGGTAPQHHHSTACGCCHAGSARRRSLVRARGSHFTNVCHRHGACTPGNRTLQARQRPCGPFGLLLAAARGGRLAALRRHRAGQQGEMGGGRQAGKAGWSGRAGC